MGMLRLLVNMKHLKCYVRKIVLTWVVLTWAT